MHNEFVAWHLKTSKKYGLEGKKQFPTWYHGLGELGQVPFHLDFSFLISGTGVESPIFLVFCDSKKSPLENWDLCAKWPPGRQARRCLPDDPVVISNNVLLLLYFPRTLMDHQVSNQDHGKALKWVIFNLPPFLKSSLFQFKWNCILLCGLQKKSTVVLSPGFNLGPSLL
jgi:hypothetical protein